MTDPKLTEADLCRYVVRYFQDQHWDVYQEVQLRQGGPIADLVVTQRKLVGIVECKQSLGLPVLEQAFGWKPYAHLVWVATWKNGNRSQLAWNIMKDYGLGYITQYRTNPDSNYADERFAPRLLRLPPNLELLTQKLKPEHKTTVAAGSNRGGYLTPFKMTCWELSRIVEEQPGITLREALGKFKHHYASTRSAMCNLPQWIAKGKVSGVRLDRSDGRPRLQLEPKQAAPEKA